MSFDLRAPELLFPPPGYRLERVPDFPRVAVLVAETRGAAIGYDFEVAFEPDLREDGAFASAVRRYETQGPVVKHDLVDGLVHWHARARFPGQSSAWSEVRALMLDLEHPGLPIDEGEAALTAAGARRARRAARARCRWRDRCSCRRRRNRG